MEGQEDKPAPPAGPVAWFNYGLIALAAIAIAIALWAFLAGTTPTGDDQPPVTPAAPPATSSPR